MGSKFTPEKHCCVAMTESITLYGIFEYNKCFDVGIHPHLRFKSFPWTRVSYCPYCGEELESFRNLYFEEQNYYLVEKHWEIKEFDRYWDLCREGASESEAKETVLLERESPP